MRIAILSDCQFDVPSDRGTDPRIAADADVLVVAGDYFPSLTNSLLRLKAIAERMPVVYVAGNRDFYGRDISVETRAAREIAGGGLHFLQDQSVVIDSVRFVGATLWTDYEASGGLRHCADEMHQRVNDHRMIRDESRRWSPESAYAAHVWSRRYIEATLANAEEPVVAVTHHAPARGSINPLHPQLNGAFVSDLSTIMETERAPVLWVHGATHHAVDYTMGRTRIVSNPLGYPGEDTGYVESLVVEITA